MSKKYYLRIEGVNLSNFVYDTQDLNTIRGGGLILLDSIDELEKKFNGKLKPISTGASSGLFEVNVSNIDDAKDIKKRIEDHIKQDECLKHATFVIDILESDDKDFNRDRETILALNRWRQMQSLSIAVPLQSSDKPCRIDMVRPAVDYSKYKDEGYVRVSESIYYRRGYGRDQKQDFYKKYIEDKTYVNELDELTKDESKGNLHHKMAVIYIDGNSFGKIQQGIKNPSELNKWDTTIKCYRWKMFRELLEKTVGKPDKPEWTNNGKHRIETLLWGGDEIIWVVPAWVGWWTLSFFYQHTKDKNWNFNGEPLKHAAGIVFCHHNAPIHRITKLAKELAELAKDKDRKKSLFVYQKLESFDHIGKDIRDYIKHTYGDRIKPYDLVLDGEKMSEIKENINALKEKEFSKSGLYKIVQSIISNQGNVDELVKKNTKNDDDIENALKNLAKLLGEHARWIHIAELWDYII